MLVLPGHVEQPGQPLQEHGLHPAGHLVGVRQPVVVVEDEDGGDAAGAHHEHDAAEVHPWNTRTSQLQIYFISIGFRCWNCYGNGGGLVCSGLVSPMRGVVSVMGSMSPTIEEKMVMASMIVTPDIQNTECDKCVNIDMKQKI